MNVKAGMKKAKKAVVIEGNLRKTSVKIRLVLAIKISKRSNKVDAHNNAETFVQPISP